MAAPMLRWRSTFKNILPSVESRCNAVVAAHTSVRPSVAGVARAAADGYLERDRGVCVGEGVVAIEAAA